MDNHFTLLLSALNTADKSLFANLQFNDINIIDCDTAITIDTFDAQPVNLIVVDANNSRSSQLPHIVQGGIRIPMLCLIDDNISVESMSELSAIGVVHFVFRSKLSSGIVHVIDHYKTLFDQQQQLQNDFRSANLETVALAYSISHDLMAPVRAINGYSKILSEDIGEHSNPQVAQMLSRLQANSTKLGDMITAILELSRISTIIMQPQMLDMADLAKHAINLYQPPNAQISVDISNLSPVFADSSLIQIVWNALISNAFKFTSDISGIKIVIGSTLSEKHVTYYVTDNGVGFDMEHSKRLFKAFQRLHSSVDFQGLGTGLVVAEKIVKRHAGTMWIDSAINGGTTVYFSLPT